MNTFNISLPATSANLGPGFDSLALALDLHLEVSAATAETYSIHATGRDSERCMNMRNNLVITTYEDMLRKEGKAAQPLAIQMLNGIPLGMGCGSSAAARLAGIALANHFGDLRWNSDRILFEASIVEGHPDNAAACWLGGFTVSATYPAGVKAVSISPPADWSAILVCSKETLSTSAARAILPETYKRPDAIANLQNAALLTAAFFTGRADLLQFAMQDCLHQPYRSVACPLLPLLLPLAGEAGIVGVALSGAGPAVLVLLANANAGACAVDRIEARLTSKPFEILQVKLLPSFPQRSHSGSFS